MALLNRDIEFFTNHDDCPTCKQTIDSEFRANYIDNKKDEVDKIKDGLAKLSEQYDDENDKLNKIMNALTDINSKNLAKHKLENNVQSLIEYYNQLEREINRINDSHEIDENDKFAELKREIEDISTRYNEAVEQKKIYSVVGALLKDTGIKAKIIRQYIPVINKLINKYLAAMEFLVQFELDEEFNETIKSRFRDEFSYASFSEGEKMRINLAVLFTWRAVAKLRNSVNTNLLIMDEVFDSSLDSNGTEEFMKLLNGLTAGNNTFIISHKTDQLFDKFVNVIRFEKHKNFSRMVS